MAREAFAQVRPFLSMDELFGYGKKIDEEEVWK